MEGPLQSTDFAQLRAFLVVAERLSFSRAAETLGLSPSALSHTVRGLEERLGVQLLNRTTRSVALTASGAALVARLAPAMEAVTSAVLAAQHLRDRPSGTVRLHMAAGAARLHVGPMLAAFVADYPDVTLDITVDDSVIDMVARGFDAAIRPREVIERDMIAVRIGADHRQVPFASPTYLDAHGRPQTPRDLTEHRCIRWRWSGQATPYAWELCRDAEWFEVAVTGPLIVDDRAMMIGAAIDGVGIAFATEAEIASDVAAGRLEPVLVDWTDRFPGYFLFYPKQRQMAPALLAFIDAIRRS